MDGGNGGDEDASTFNREEGCNGGGEDEAPYSDKKSQLPTITESSSKKSKRPTVLIKQPSQVMKQQ
jgi:hypothetical protein